MTGKYMSSFSDDLRVAWNGGYSALSRIIIVNVAVWLLINAVNLFVPQAPVTLLGGWLMMPSNLPQLMLHPWSLLTNFFTHEGFFHLLWNMLTLYWFGMILTELLGNRRLLSLYFLGGLAGGLSYLAISSLLPQFAGVGALGASAAVNAIVVGAATLTPDYRMHLLFFGPVKIKYIALAMVVLSIFSLRGNMGAEVAHLGGALMGFAFIRNLREGNDWGRPINFIFDWFGRLFTRRSNMKVSYRKQKATTIKYTNMGAPAQEVVDAILDKIHASGYEKLTDEEKQILFRASQKRD
jgi:membrane associated rhomboid family serine protease